MTSQAAKQKVYTPTPLRLTYGTEDLEEVVPVISQCTPPRTSQADPSCKDRPIFPERSHWEECVTNSGVKKVKLVPELEVYLTQGQLSQVKHSGAENARKMTIALLDVLFSREQLAQSSARGSKKAHNATCKTLPLPDITVQAVKRFVLNQFKKENGDPCLTDPMFNDIINSKCATARRSLKR